MESEQYSRIIFININDLQKIKFSKLEQVCDEVYVFVDKSVKTIPLNLVQQLQHLGENVKWIVVQGTTDTIMANYVSFYLGRLHDQLDADIEFAIISENAQLDYLIQHINEKGRGCIRVTRNKEKTATPSDLNSITWSPDNGEIMQKANATADRLIKSEKVEPVVKEEKIIRQKQTTQTAKTNGLSLSHRVAQETIKRLLLSGNRPAALNSLKNYILLQYNSDAVKQQINAIIQEMENSKEIVVQNEEVVYNF